MNAMSLSSNDDQTERWWRFLSRWALVAGLAGVGLLVVYIGGVGIAPSDAALGPEFTELMQAVRSPALYRVATLLDALGWALMAGVLLSVAMIVRHYAPIRAVLIAACAIGLISGVLGGFMRLVGLSQLAGMYAAATPAQQSGVLAATLTLENVIAANFAAGDLLAGVAFVLAAWSLAAIAGFPRWLALWLGLVGILSLVLFVVAATGGFSFPLVFLTVLVMFGAYFAIAFRLRRPLPAMTAAASA